MKKHLIILILLCAILFIWRIGSIPILDGDTASAAVIAKNIVNSGNWISMQTMEGSITSKPPLFYWILALGFKLFGINEFGLSILHSIIAGLTVLLTYLIAKELYTERIAFWSALILLTSAQFFYQGRSPLYDMPLTFFIAAAFYCFILYEKQRKPIFYFLIPIFTGLAFMIKGPVGLALVGVVLLIYVIWSKKIKKYLNWYLVSAIIVFLLIVSPWFIAEYQVLGNKLLDVFWYNNAVRFFHPLDSVGNDPSVNTAVPQYDFYSYFIQIFILFVPWAGFLYPAIFSNIKDQKSHFIISWILGIIIFFSLSLNYKVSRYILPAFPALAIIVGKFICDASENIEKLKKPIAISKWITVLLIIPLLVIGTIYMINSFPTQQQAYRPIVLPFIIIFTLGMIVFSIFLFRNKLELAMKLSVLFCFVSYSVLILCINVYFPKANPIKEFCGIINQKNDGIPVLYKADSSSHFAGFYLNDEFVQTRDVKNVKNLRKMIPKVYIISEDPDSVNDFSKIKVIEKKSNFVLFLKN